MFRNNKRSFKMIENIFHALGTANKEKIHSEFLAWFFNLPSNIINDKEKTNFLKKLFKDENIKSLTSFETFTEIENIDIIIKTDKTVFVIENKLKSSEHDKQTEKYKKIIENDKLPKKLEISKDSVYYYGFLTLIGEEAETNDWITITYSDLAKAFGTLKNINDNKEFNKYYSFINEYIDALTDIIKVWDNFSANYFEKENKGYNEVIFGDKLSKTESTLEKLTGEKYSENWCKSFIKKYSFRLIFEKSIFHKLVKELENEKKDLKFKNYNITSDKDSNTNSINWHISETNGTALIHFDIEYFYIENEKEKENEKRLFTLGFQVQDNSFKINCQRPGKLYENSEPEDINDIIPIFEKYKNVTVYNKLNKPTKKALVSISKSLGAKNGRLNLTYKEYHEKFTNEFNNALNIIKELKQIIMNDNSIKKK